MVSENDPRPVLRKELARVFQNQRVIRAFEKIFDLIPPEFINQQTQLDALNLISEFAASQANNAVAAVTRLTDVLEQLTLVPTILDTLPPDDLRPVEFQYSLSIGINQESVPALSQAIAPTWTNNHIFSPTAGVAVTVNGVAGSNIVTLNGANQGLGINSTGATAPIKFVPTGGDAWTVQAGALAVSDFGITNVTRGTTPFSIAGGGGAGGDVATFIAPFITKGYTVATLPAGVLGMVAHVTDALAPAFLTAVVGGGAVKSLVFYNGAAWVAG